MLIQKELKADDLSIPAQQTVQGSAHCVMNWVPIGGTEFYVSGVILSHDKACELMIRRLFLGAMCLCDMAHQ